MTLAKDIIAIARRGVGVLANQLIAVDANGRLPIENGWDIIVEDQKAFSIEGGTGSTGWNNRMLNTVLVNNIVGASLVSDAVRLPAGTYQAEWHAPAFNVGRNRSVLYDKTRSSILCLGSSEYSNQITDGSSVQSSGTGRFTIASRSDVIVRHYLASPSGSSYNLGLAGSAPGLVEVYSRLLVKRLS